MKAWQFLVLGLGAGFTAGLAALSALGTADVVIVRVAQSPAPDNPTLLEPVRRALEPLTPDLIAQPSVAPSLQFVPLREASSTNELVPALTHEDHLRRAVELLPPLEMENGPCSLSGTVLYDTGEPVAGVVIEMYFWEWAPYEAVWNTAVPDNAPSASQDTHATYLKAMASAVNDIRVAASKRFSATTSANGTFRIENLPAHEYRASVRGPCCVIESKDINEYIEYFALNFGGEGDEVHAKELSFTAKRLHEVPINVLNGGDSPRQAWIQVASAGKDSDELVWESSVGAIWLTAGTYQLSTSELGYKGYHGDWGEPVQVVVGPGTPRVTLKFPLAKN